VHPRAAQGVATAVLLLAFLADAHPVVPLVALVLIAQLVAGARPFPSEEESGARLTVLVEVLLLAVATVFFLIGHSGWAWGLAFLATLVAGLAAVAELWLARPGGYVRRPQ